MYIRINYHICAYQGWIQATFGGDTWILRHTKPKKVELKINNLDVHDVYAQLLIQQSIVCNMLLLWGLEACLPGKFSKIRC